MTDSHRHLLVLISVTSDISTGIMATTPKRRTLNHVSEDVWAATYARFINNDVNLQDLLSPPLYDFLFHFSRKASTSVGFLLPAILVTINFILAAKGGMVQVKRDFERNLNLFWVMVGSPTTGKTTAINSAVVTPLTDVPDINNLRLTIIYL